jgi:LysR family transcriptional regulator, regulator for genes of the gallate degradation pathway
LTVMTSYELKEEGGALAALSFDPPIPAPAIGVTMRTDWLPTQLHQEFIGLLHSRIVQSTEALP